MYIIIYPDIFYITSMVCADGDQSGHVELRLRYRVVQWWYRCWYIVHELAASFRLRCPPRNCTRRSASSRHPCAVPTAVNPRRSGAFRCPIHCSGSPASTCWRDASSSGRHRRPTAVVAPWPLLPVASSCVLCACFGTKPWPDNRKDLVIIYKRTAVYCTLIQYYLYLNYLYVRTAVVFTSFFFFTLTWIQIKEDTHTLLRPNIEI